MACRDAKGQQHSPRVKVLENTEGLLHLRVTLTEPPPTRAGVDLLLAIPRPKALKKVLPAVASLGEDRVVLVNVTPLWLPLP